MKMMMTLLAAGLLMMGTAVWADDDDDDNKGMRTYEVTVTNVTKGLKFTPLLAATHSRRVSYFMLGERASDALADLAEGGATGPLETWLLYQGKNVHATHTTGGLLGPGESVTFWIDGSRRANRLSIAGMLLPTNDTFMAINSMKLPKKTSAHSAVAYDAGSEENDELCMNIPGPTCMGVPFSMGMAEGYVYIGNGIHGNGNLSADEYDWRNPVAHVSVTRVH